MNGKVDYLAPPPFSLNLSSSSYFIPWVPNTCDNPTRYVDNFGIILIESIIVDFKEVSQDSLPRCALIWFVIVFGYNDGSCYLSRRYNRNRRLSFGWYFHSFSSKRIKRSCRSRRLFFTRYLKSNGSLSCRYFFLGWIN